jgi:hypothetical protein
MCYVVCGHVLLRDFWPYEIIFMNLCVVITVAMAMLLKDFGSYGIIITACVFTTLYFPVILDRRFTGI